MNIKIVQKYIQKIPCSVIAGIVFGSITGILMLMAQGTKHSRAPMSVVNHCPMIQIVHAGQMVRAEGVSIEGIASYYSSTGCLGCNKNLIMANGEKLVDSARTLALTPGIISQYKLLNDTVLITNKANGKTTSAKVTDSGGFGKYNRVADLSVGTRDAIECSSLCEVEINF